MGRDPERRKGSFAITIEAFTPLRKTTRAAAVAHGRSYEPLLGAPVEVSWVDRLSS